MLLPVVLSRTHFQEIFINMADEIEITFDNNGRVRVLDAEQFEKTKELETESVEFAKSSYLLGHFAVNNAVLRLLFGQISRGDQVFGNIEQYYRHHGEEGSDYRQDQAQGVNQCPLAIRCHLNLLHHPVIGDWASKPGRICSGDSTSAKASTQEHFERQASLIKKVKRSPGCVITTKETYSQ